jgi:phenylalanyl-tRNA synthetase alpha chain
MKSNIFINYPKEKELIKDLEKRTDIKAERVKRLLALPDLSRTDDSPLKAIVKRVTQIKDFEDFDVITIPEIIPTNVLFDLFDFAKDHPARSESDTYYVDENNVLRTHDTVMWYYYLNDPEIRERARKGETMGVFCYGKVYRKDEVDRHHMNVFHQMGGLYLVPDSQKMLSIDDLKDALSLIVRSLFGSDVVFRFNVDTFPYTDPSLEVEVQINGKWIEILGGGMPKKIVLKNFGIEGYNGWAFGFGLERLGIIKMEISDIRIFWAKDPRITGQLKNIDTKYKEVSKYPETSRDISFIIDKNINLNNYYEIVRDFALNLIEEVKLVDEFENEEKFGADKKSYTFRIVYRSPERTLTSEEINKIQEEIRQETVKQLNAVLR